MRVEIEIVTSRLVNQAMAHNGLGFLRRVVVSFPGATGPIDAVTVRAELRDGRGEPLTRPWQLHLEAVPGDVPLSVDDPPLRLDAAAMSGLDEEDAGELAVSVQVGDAEPVLSFTPVRVLAARQWLVDPHAELLSLELLAAFVQPNHPALERLVQPIADRVLKQTGLASLAVTDAPSRRVDAIVEAAFTAVHDLGITYLEPPASWGYGQKVRGPGDVLGGRAGTCLDTTVTLASLLEHLGVGTILWIARGHAFLGYWRGSGLGLPDAVSLQVASAVNAVDLGLAGLLETTFLTRERRPPRDLFRRASQVPVDRYVRGGTGELVGVVDVAMARMLRVLPLPARHERPDGVVEIVEYSPAAPASLPASRPGSLPAPATVGDTPGDRPRTVRGEAAAPPRVQAWKNALFDLTLRNPLLNLGRGLTQLPLHVPHEHLDALADLLQDARSVTVRAVDDLAWASLGEQLRSAPGLPGDVQRAMLLQRHTVFSEADAPTHRHTMDRLRYRTRTSLQETGANLLHVTFGRLDWTLGERRLSAPLLLAPVQIKGMLPPYRIALDPAGHVVGNLSLVEKLRAEFGFSVPELREPPLRADGEGVDVGATVRAVREAIAAAGLPFRVDDEARLAVVAFTGYLLWRDLDEHWRTFLESPLFRHVALTPTQPFGDPADPGGEDDDAHLDAVAAAAPIPVDGSQAEAVAAARRGRSFVLEGPPGTGKSQTITNILADQMAQGRTVLFVAEKGAALDVVRARLEQAGLAPLTLDLHDDQARPAEVRQQLRSALALRPQADTDAYTVAAGDVTTCAAALRDYARRVHEPGPAGLSLYGARTLQLARGDGPALSVPATAPGVREAVARAVEPLARLSPGTAASWGFAHRAPADPARWTADVTAADRAVVAMAQNLLPGLLPGVVPGAAPGAAQPDAGPLAERPRTRQALAEATTVDELAAVVRLLGDDADEATRLREISSPRWRSAAAELEARTAAVARDATEVLARFAPAVVGAASAARLPSVRQALREAAASFVLGRKRRLLAAAAPLLAHLRPGAEVPPKQLPALADEVADLAARCADLVGAWRALPGCGLLPPDLNLLTDEGRHRLEHRLATLRQDAALLGDLRAALGERVEKARASEPPLDAVSQGLLDGAVGAVGTVLAGCASRAADQSRWATGAGLLDRWARTAAGRAADLPALAALHRWVDASVALAPLEGIAEDARRELLTGAVEVPEAVSALERGLAAASVAERLDTQGLSTFDAGRHDRTVDRFVTAGAELRGTLRSALPAAVVERRPFRSGRVLGTVAALEREVNRTRGGLTVRRLVEQFGPVIAEVTPCLLVSPDSLARFVPPGSMTFDLVVFDEASQITVADAVGALGRARAAVVAGDTKQLPPTSFAQLGRDDDEPAGPPSGDPDRSEGDVADFAVVPDEESILSEAVMAGLPRLWLTWHYRSRDESLIAFSNARYYEGRLLTFPAPPGRDLDAGVSFTRVPGHFVRPGGPAAGPLRTNPAEAAAVVAEVVRRWRAGERSIGVVTFNVQQRALVEAMLVESGEPGLPESLDSRRDGLFVKNLENVQGDERDVVLFSTAFSAAGNGVLPLNFGPLNRVGGERRLNVAVTRARRRVMVFSSFDPEDLRADETSSVGIKHLRAYLEAARDARGGNADGSTAARGTAARGTAARATATVDRHRDEVAARLRARGLEVSTGLGTSDFQVDLGVAAPGAPAGAPPVLAVLVDSPAWARRRTTGDRYALATTVLEDFMGWPAVARVWLPRWLAAPDAVLDELVHLATAARTVPVRRGGLAVTRTSAAVAPGTPGAPELPGAPALSGTPEPPGTLELPGGPEVPAAGTAGDPDPVGLTASSAPGRPFVAFEAEQLAGVRRLDALAAGRPSPDVEALVRRIVDVEGPIAMPRLARFVARCHGLTRVQPARLADITRAVPGDLRRDEEGFVWPPHRDPLRWAGYRTFAGPLRDRPLEEVSLVEIANALCDLAHGAMGIGVDDLHKEALRAFGGTRLTGPNRARLTEALDRAVVAERLAVTAGVVRALR